MRKLLRRILFCSLMAAIVWMGMLFADREMLNEQLIRFHVVGASDSQLDQNVKIQVRDAVLEAIQRDLQSVTDVDAARQYLKEKLPKIEAVANETLKNAGMDQSAVVSLCREAFDIRRYETFSLPGGVYETLRIVIGEGKGHNWWCVAFPSLCLTATTEEFEAAAAGSGFSDGLTDTLAGRANYQIRFYLLDKLGQLENILGRGSLSVNKNASASK